ncbi:MULTISPECIES: hypothetical protein [unclassified Microcoleus]|uniref:hypothetical protein n=1 Tax=unclassified Microcoleus TaxID=2642155 RepID=UPI0025EF95A5|nr:MULTISPECIES: hypothetical protein [unclassified Microcoleus]
MSTVNCQLSTVNCQLSTNDWQNLDRSARARLYLIENEQHRTQTASPPSAIPDCGMFHLTIGNKVKFRSNYPAY